MALALGLALPGIATSAEPVTSRGSSKRITLIPCGCTKLRISMFPITSHILPRRIP